VSRIYDALKDAEKEKSSPRPKGRQSGASTEERRRGNRRAMRVPLFVYGYSKEKVPFLEATDSVGVSDNGALLILSAEVTIGQKLVLLNRLNGMEQECTVVRVGQRRYKMPIGVRFSQSSPEFWVTSGAMSTPIPAPRVTA